MYAMIFTAVGKVLDVAKVALDAGDSEKYAASVEKLNKGVNDTFGEMRQIIVNSNKLSDEEKLVKLAELAKQEEEANQKCNEAITGNRESVSKVVLDIVKGFATCGLYFMPDIAKRLKKMGVSEEEFIETNIEPVEEKTSAIKKIFQRKK